MNNQAHLTTLHNEHVEWSRKLNFYADEISSFENRLSEIVQQNNKQEVLAPLEHFQNQFIRQKEVIDTLNHEINVFEDRVVEKAKENNVATDHKRMEDHDELRGRMTQFEKVFSELKEEFTKYLSKVL